MNMSAKPTMMVLDAASASGSCSRSSKGTKGAPSQLKMGVCSASIRAQVPIAITTGSTPNTMSRAFFTPSRATAPRSVMLSALARAR
ncbi:hypothetical protein D3C80_1928500 [compost metagenome]